MKAANLVRIVGMLVAFLSGSVYAVPTIFHSSETANPGDVISLQGDSFGAAPQVWMQHVMGTEPSLSPQVQLKVVNSSVTNVAALIPSNETTGLYAIWVYDGTNYSSYVLVNAARAWGANDLCGTQIDPTRAFRLFGRNLYFGSGTPTVTFVNGGTTLNATVTTSGSDANILHVTAPAGLVAGTVYTVNVNNGFGGHYGTSSLRYTLTGVATGTDPFGLGVPWGSVFATISTRTYNVKTGYGAYGDGVHDDSIPIQNAMNAASTAGGGIVYFPAGTYQLSFGHAGNVNDFLTVPSNVVFEGAGATSSTLVMSNATVLPIYNFGIAGAGVSNVGFINIGVHNLHGASGGTTTSVGLRGGAHIFLINSTFLADGGKNLVINENTNVLIKNSTIINTAVTASDIAEAIYNLSNTDVWFSGNTVSWYFARVRFNYSERTLIENNTFTRNAINNGTLVESGGIDASFSDSMVVYNNTIKKGGSVPLTQNNDGETILVQWSNAPYQAAGTVTGATSTTLTDATQDWTNNYSVPEANVSGQLYYVVVVGGPGAGQFRQMTGNTTTTLTVSPAWQVTPTSASTYSIVHFDAAHHLIKNNSLSQNTQGIEYYATSYEDTTFVGNTLTDNGGIWMRTDYRPAATLSSFQVNMDSQILNNTISNPSSLYSETDSYSKIFYEIGSNGISGSLGTNVFGGDVRNNMVTAPLPNHLTGIDGEGCTLKMSGPAETNTDMGIVGVVFQNNTIVNCTNAFHLCTGDYYNTIWNNDYSTCTNLVTDLQQGSGTITHPSVSTVYGSLTGNWNFDAGTGGDSSGNVGTGTLIGSPVFSTDIPYTTMGNVYSLQVNKTNRMEVPNTSILDTGNELTVAFWMKADPTGANYERPINKELATSTTGWAVQLQSATNFFMRIDTSAGANQTKGGMTGLLDGNWHFITYVLNHGTISAYKDGTLAVTQTYLAGNGFGGNGQPIEVGAGPTGTDGFLGKLDDIQIYAQALTTAQISALYSSY